MVYFMENPIRIDDLEVPLFLETPIFVGGHENDYSSAKTPTSSEPWLMH